MKDIVINQSVTLHSPLIDRYLVEIGKFNLLTADDEVVLCEKIKSGDAAALNKLVNANLRFVVSVAKKYQHMGLSLEDLISEGNAGLIKAARRFDSTKGFKFISFAVWWIRQAIIQAIDHQRRIVRLPGNIILNVNQINQAQMALEQLFERTPTLEELAEAMGISEEKIADHLWHATPSVSLDRPFSLDGGNEGRFVDILENKNAEETDKGLITDDRNLQLRLLLNKLPYRERLIITLSHGIGTGYAMESEDVALMVGLSKERVRQLRLKALKQLRAMVNKELFY